MWEFLKGIDINTAIWAVIIIFGAVQTWRANKKGFWLKLKDAAMDLIDAAEKEFGASNGSIKKEWVVEQLIELFGKKFSPFTKKRVERVIDFLVGKMNKYSEPTSKNLNK